MSSNNLENIVTNKITMDNNDVLEICSHANQYHHNLNGSNVHPYIPRTNHFNNVDLNVGHACMCGMYAKHIACGKIKAGIVDAGEYDVNGKVVIDGRKNFYGKSLTINGVQTINENRDISGNTLHATHGVFAEYGVLNDGSGGNVEMTVDSSSNFYLNGVDPLIPHYVPPIEKTINEKDFCQNWSMSITKYVVTGYAVSVDSSGQYQTMVDNAGYIYTSDTFGKYWSEGAEVAPGRQFVSLAMSNDGKYQMTMDSIGFIYTSNDYGKTWLTRNIIELEEEIYRPFVGCISISQSGRYQIVCIESRTYASDDYGLSFINLGSAVESNDVPIMQKVIVKEGSNPYDYAYASDNSGNYTHENADAIVIAIAYNDGNVNSNRNYVMLMSYGISDSGWIDNGNLGNYWRSIGHVDTKLNSIAVSDDLSRISVSTNTGFVIKSDTSGGLINNSFFSDASGAFEWNSEEDILLDTSGARVMDIAMSANGLYQTTLLNHEGDGKILVSTDSSGNNLGSFSIKLTVEDVKLTFINMSNDGSYQYCCDNAGNIYASHSYGDTWEGVTVDAQYTDIACSKSGKYVTITDTSGQIFTSTNFGKMWSTANLIVNDSSGNGLNAVSMSDTGQYQYTISDHYVYESTSYGKNWRMLEGIEGHDGSGITTAFAPLVDIAVSGDGKVVAIIDNSIGNYQELENNLMVYISTNVRNTHDASFCSVVVDDTEHTISNSATSIALSETGQYMYITCVNGNIYGSADFGQHWKKINPLANDENNLVDLIEERFDPLPRVAVSKNGQQIATTMNFTLGSSDTFGNINMILLNNPECIAFNVMNLLEEDWQYIYDNRGLSGIAMSEDGQYLLACDKSNNLFTSNSNAFVNLQLSGNDVIPAIKAQSVDDCVFSGVAMSGNGKYQYAIGSRANGTGLVFVSNSYGDVDSFTSTSTAMYHESNFIDADLSADGKICTAIDIDGNAYRSSDSGKTWSHPINVGDISNLLGVALNKSGEIQYTVSPDNGSLHKSVDFGETWNEIYEIEDNEFFCVATSDTGKYVTVGDVHGNLHVSHDFGETFALKETGYDGPVFSIAMSGSGEHQTMVVIEESTNSHIFRSKTYGVLWEDSTNASFFSLSIAMSRSGQHVTTPLMTFSDDGIVMTSSTYGSSFDAKVLYYVMQENNTILNCSTAMSSSGKYQVIVCVAEIGFFIYKSVDYGHTWNLTKNKLLFNSLVHTTVNFFTFMPRVKISGDGTHVLIAFDNVILSSRCEESIDNVVNNKLTVEDSAVIETLTTHTMNVNGGFIAKTTMVYGNYTQVSDDYVLMCKTSMGASSITLNSDAPLGQMLLVTDVDMSGNITIGPSAGKLLNGSSTPVTNVSYKNYTLMSIGNGNWIIVSEYPLNEVA